jgi:dienelactone hydrolase
MIPLALIHGDQEKWLNDDKRRGPGCKRFLEKGKVELHILPNAHHAFDNPRFEDERKDIAGNTMLYSEKATNSAREIVKAFLTKHLSGK